MDVLKDFRNSLEGHFCWEDFWQLSARIKAVIKWRRYEALKDLKRPSATSHVDDMMLTVTIQMVTPTLFWLSPTMVYVYLACGYQISYKTKSKSIHKIKTINEASSKQARIRLIMIFHFSETFPPSTIYGLRLVRKSWIFLIWKNTLIQNSVVDDLLKWWIHKCYH